MDAVGGGSSRSSSRSTRGQPEPLKGEPSGHRSRRIDDEHRLVHRADEKEA
ncbi:type II toxin-antitoxin system YoeB family toxin [Streptomyces sp. NPDC051771]|uniref:type II toxin-antitoxin system YoeB family toxin n=1 Tax=Streptomyces sp. NPDC051771 TaxID=3154847 RepID=UPI003444DDEC